MNIKSKTAVFITMLSTLTIILCVACNALTNDEVTSALNNLKLTYEDGKYWNHSSGQSVYETVTTTPCSHHGSNCDYYGNCGCNSFGNAIQCGSILNVGVKPNR